MPTPPITKQQAQEALALVQSAVNDGYVLDGIPSAIEEAGRRPTKKGVKLNRRTLRDRYKRALEMGFKLKPAKLKAKPATAPKIDLEKASEKLRAALKSGPKTLPELSLRTKLPIGALLDAVGILQQKGVNVQRFGDRYDIPALLAQAYVGGAVVEILSRPDNTFLFGAFGDLHAGSKYTRWDVRQDLVRRSEAMGAQAIMDTGNWIDGDARFNRYDLEVSGLEEQCALLARKHPKTDLPIYAVAGDDHEGWIAAREGVNVGRYCENVMRQAGHNWHDLGYMEAHIMLRNANSGAAVPLAVVHPGGGSAYALSYSIQKIVESYEGGEKPAVGFYGHYHKLWAGVIRNVWCVQTGCQQDQTPFMRKRRLEAHVGGAVVELEQDPRTGAIIAMTPKLLRYFNKGWYEGGERWSHHGKVIKPDRSIEAIRT